MGSSSHLSKSLCWLCLFLVQCSNLIKVTNSSSSMQPLLCKEEESTALLLFKQSFSIKKFASVGHSAYPKVASWKLVGENSDCCLWDGVECDKDSGHVISLNLSSSFLYGSINSSSSLFNLVHLQRLNLGDNHFNDSKIPSAISKLSRLTSLDLLASNFSGQIPSEVLGLSKLTSLVLSFNPLKLHKPGFSSLVENLTSLQMLHLSDVDISSAVPHTLANLSSLTSLILTNCGLYGQFPIDIFHLNKLQVLRVPDNQNLTGYLPEFNQSIPLKELRLASSNFSGDLPLDYFQTWKAMTIVEVGGLIYMHTNISYQTWKRQWNYDYEYSLTMTNKGIPMAYDKIQTFLNAIDLSSNKFGGKIPECIGYLRGLQLLNLSNNALVGSIPSFLGNLTNLEALDLSQNKLSGEIPQQLTLLTFLSFFNVSHNHLTGRIPHGKQFDTFQSNSYEGNLGLCGNPLSKNCGDSESSPPPPPSFFEQNEDSEFPSKIDWIIICTGFGSGLAVGLVIGHTLTTRKHEWFVKTFGRRQQKWRHERKRE